MTHTIATASDDASRYDRVRGYVAGLTRQGIHSGGGRSRGIDLGDDLILTTETIEQTISGISERDLSILIRELALAPPRTLNLTSSEVLKLRASLVLGAGEARFLSGDERRDALVRTYPRPSAHRHPALSSPVAYRERYSELRRVERDQLLAEIAALIIDNFDAAIPAPSNVIVDPYRILRAVDEHTYPGRAEGGVRIVRRRRVLLAQENAVHTFRQSYTHVTHGGAAPEFHAVGTGKFRVENLREYRQDEVCGYRYDVVIDFPPLKVGETVEIGWDTHFRLSAEDQWVSSSLADIHLAPRLPIDIYKLSIRFSAPAIPRKLWAVTDASATSLRLDLRDDAVLTQTDGHVTYEWTNPRMGRASGIVWRWP